MKFTLKIIGGWAGFTLTETIIVVLISSILMGAVMSTFIQYVNTSSQQSAQDDINAEVSSLFKVIEKDVMMASYGLPARTRIASTAFCNYSGLDKTSSMLFVADGLQILKAITDNNEDDGHIVTNPTNYLTFVTTRKNSAAGGYSTQITVNTQNNNITLLALNINAGEEFTVSNTDFIAGNALIIGNNTRVEGYMIDSVASSGVITPKARDTFFTYSSSRSPSVVPAIVWFVKNDPDGKKYSDGTPVKWLYRNGSKVLPNVSNFNVKYGYDAKNDGLQWSDSIPPASTSWTGAPDPDGVPYDFSSLKVIQVSITVKSMYKTDVKSYSYQTAILLRN